MNRKTFLTAICALFTAPFIGKSKEKKLKLFANGKEIATLKSNNLPRLATQADVDLYNPENGLRPRECDWLITEKDGVKHITHQYINGKWVDVNELKF